MVRKCEEAIKRGGVSRVYTLSIEPPRITHSHFWTTGEQPSKRCPATAAWPSAPDSMSGQKGRKRPLRRPTYRYASAARPCRATMLPRGSMPCVGCGRELRHKRWHHFAESFCSEACEESVYARREARQRRRRNVQQGVFCACCEMSFKPKRRGDALTCSPACRQKLYRKRVTDQLMARSEP